MDEAIFARGEELEKEIGHFFAKVNGHAGGGDIGIVVPIHKHPTKDESFVILRGKVSNDDGSIIEDVVLSQESGNYGVDIPKNVWHKLESLESGSVIFECKEGAFVEHEEEGILEVKSE